MTSEPNASGPPAGGGDIVDPREVLATCLARITERNDALRAVVALDHEGAERAALESVERRRRGAQRSPIDGALVLVKANIAVAGLPWHAGIAAYDDRIAAEDAPAVARLREAGAVILGLTNMDEGALGASGDNPWLGRIGNPLRPGFSAGGSSGGSAAAVAAGFCTAALGTDTIGSVAIPAAYCGVVGHRASRHLMSITDVAPLSPSFDHAGWHSRTTADALALRRALGPPTSPTGPFRLATLAVDGLDLEPEVAGVIAAATEAAQAAAWTIDAIACPVSPGHMARRLFEVVEAEGAAAHRARLEARPGGFSPTFRRLLAWGGGPGAARRADHLVALHDAAAVLRTALLGYDALLLPATPHSGFAAGSPAPPDQALFAAIPACLGWPATTVPAGAGQGLLITAPSDDLCLTIADRLSALLR